MSFLNITPEQARVDARRYREQLRETLHALSGVRGASPGCTPRDSVYVEDKVTLYRYRSPDGDKVESRNSGPAVLICYALINRPSMMDLQEDR